MISRLFHTKKSTNQSISSPVDAHVSAQPQAIPESAVHIEEKSRASFDNSKQWNRRDFIIFKYDDNGNLIGSEWNWEKNYAPRGIRP